MATKKTKKVQYLGTGRRKTAIARVRLVPGDGNIVINKRTLDEYFPLDTMKLIVNQPLVATNTSDKFDVFVNVYGGGYTGQAGAIRHGIAPHFASQTAKHTEQFSRKKDISLVTREPKNVRNTVCIRLVKHPNSPRDNLPNSNGNNKAQPILVALFPSSDCERVAHVLFVRCAIICCPL